MAQKANPLAIRAQKTSKNLIFPQQAYHKKFLPYSLNEQKKITTFIRGFLKKYQFNLHSFNVIKNQRGNIFVLVRYLSLGFSNTKRSKSQQQLFATFEETFVSGLEKLGYKNAITVSFYQIGKKDNLNLNFSNLLRGQKFFTPQEIFQIVKGIKKTEGSAFFLGEIFSEKLESLRSKTEKKLQGRFILFLEKFILILKKHSLITHIKGIKIQIKGRINGIARSKRAVIRLGNLSLQQIDNKIDFYYRQILTAFGSFGLKVWINYL